MEDYTINNKCTDGCGKCCTRVLPLSDYELKKIHQYVRKNNIKPTHTEDNVCPFLNEEKRCQVYIHRGEICREYICNQHLQFFNHNDKKLVDLWQEFYPEIAKNLSPVDIAFLDQYYQMKKEDAFKHKKE